MTIKIERDAFLRVITRKGPLIEKLQQPQQDEEYVVVSLPTATNKGDDFFYDDLIPVSTDDEEQDDDSLLSNDSASTVSDDDEASTASSSRRVSFADDLVTDVYTRDKTLPEEVSRLYYTALETQTFRQQYRFERKMMNELSIDPDAFPEEELDSLLARASSPTSTATNALGGGVGSPSSSLSGTRHSISRVVVLHNDKLETFFHEQQDSSQQQEDDVDLLASLVSSTAPVETLQQQPTLPCCFGSTSPLALPSAPNSSDDFFDSDSFWTGSLTWY